MPADSITTEEMAMRLITAIIIAVILPLIICFMLLVATAYPQGAMSKQDISGFWVAKTEDGLGSQKFVFHFFNGKDGNIRGEIHSYLNLTKLSNTAVNNIKLDGTEISMVTNSAANILYKGNVDFQKGIILGRLIYDNGNEREMNLARYNEKLLRGEFPGLAAIRYSYKYPVPADLNDGIPVSTPSAEGIDSAGLDEMMRNVYAGKYGTLHSVLLFINGKLVLEDYPAGFCESDLHPLHSTTKSISSLLIGIAKDRGRIRSLGQNIFDFFPEYEELKTDGWADVTLENILTMSAGLDWGEGLDRKVLGEENIIKSVLERPLKDKPGSKFEYVNPNVDLLAGVIKHATGKHADVFAAENLFSPLGIKHFDWSQYKRNGYPLMDGSLALRPRDMGKIGLLILNKGKWNGERIISEDWITKSTSKQINVDNIFDYGYLWWIAKSQLVPGMTAILANGLGSQYILIVPQLNLVAVTTGANFDFKKHKLPLSMFEQYLMKGIWNNQNKLNR